VNTCAGCLKQFGNGDVSHCTCCHQTFTSTVLADKHRQGRYVDADPDAQWVKGKKFTGPRRCLTAEELTELGAVERVVRNSYRAWGYPPREGGFPMAAEPTEKETVDA
jgi:hypothetical protein